MSFWQITNISTRRAPMAAMEWSPEDALALSQFYATQGSTQPDVSNAQLHAGWTDGMRDAAKFLTDLQDASKGSEVAEMFPETPWSTVMWGLRDKNLDRFKHILSKRECYLDEWRTVSRVYLDRSGVVLTVNDLEGGTQQAIFTKAPDVYKTTISKLAALRQFPPPEPLVSEEGSKRKIIKWESRCESDDPNESEWSEADAR